jgi:hypothetical protein
MSDETFNCQIKFSQQSDLSNFVRDLDRQRIAIPQSIRDLAGRINSYAQQSQGQQAQPAQAPQGEIVTLTPPVDANTSVRKENIRKGPLYTVQAASNGRFSVAVAASRLWIAAGGAAGRQDRMGGAAVGMAPSMEVKAGEWCTFWIDPEASETSQLATFSLQRYAG